jgi:hypothetical protein
MLLNLGDVSKTEISKYLSHISTLRQKIKKEFFFQLFHSSLQYNNLPFLIFDIKNGRFKKIVLKAKWQIGKWQIGKFSSKKSEESPFSQNKKSSIFKNKTGDFQDESEKSPF